MECLRNLALAACTLAAGCTNALSDETSLSRWCGDELCDWTTDRGTIARVSSWHERDYAVSFVDTSTRISRSASGIPASCLRFEAITNVDDAARLTLVVDFGDDRTIDVEHVYTASQWQTDSVLLHVPSRANKVRYAFEKRGDGNAVVAQTWLDDTTPCTD